MNKALVIVGVDPGTTLGYAVIDLDGNIIDVNSSKEHSLNSLIEEVTKKGNPVIVATDKQKSPTFVEKFSVKVGAKLVCPSRDLLVHEKRLLTKKKHLKNTHEMDALASAFYAYKIMKPLILKVDTFIKDNKKEHIAYNLKKIVLTKGDINLKTATTLLEHPEEKETKIVQKVIQKRKFTENDFFRLYDEFQRLKKANMLLKQQNNTFKNTLNSMKKKYSSLNKQVNRLVSDEKIQKYREFKEERLQNLLSLLRSKDDEINSLTTDIYTLREFLAVQRDYILVKKLDTLGWNEFLLKNRILQLRAGDILLVNDPNIFSYKTLNTLKNKVRLIITKKPANKILMDELKCGIILNKNLIFKEERYFALIKKDAIEKTQSAKGMLNKIIDEYRHSRILE